MLRVSGQIKHLSLKSVGCSLQAVVELYKLLGAMFHTRVHGNIKAPQTHTKRWFLTRSTISKDRKPHFDDHT